MSKKAPERIYLQNWDSPVGEITWCTEKVDPDVDGVEDAEYIRKDLVDARIAELETWLSRSLGDYPCEHLPEDDVNNYPNCGYCRMQVEAMKALQSSPQTDKE